MDKMLEKLMAKKKGSKLSPEFKKAKMGVLETLRDDMSGMMSDDVKGLKKVTVAAKDKDGLKEGLNKAEELVGGEEAEGEGLDESEGEAEGDMLSAEEEAMDVNELEAKIKELEALKAKKSQA